MLPWLTVLGFGAPARVARRRAQCARLLVAALRARRGPRSSSCSSAPRVRSCRPTSCRCSRRWRSSSAGCWCDSTPARCCACCWPLVAAGAALALVLRRSPTIATRRAFATDATAGRGARSPSAPWRQGGARPSPRPAASRRWSRFGAARARRGRGSRASRCWRSTALAGLQIGDRRLRRLRARCARPRLSCGLRSRRRPSPPTRPFYQVAMYDQTVPFYLGRTTRARRVPRRVGARHRRRAGEADRRRSTAWIADGRRCRRATR